MAKSFGVLKICITPSLFHQGHSLSLLDESINALDRDRWFLEPITSTSGSAYVLELAQQPVGDVRRMNEMGSFKDEPDIRVVSSVYEISRGTSRALGVGMTLVGSDAVGLLTRLRHTRNLHYGGPLSPVSERYDEDPSHAMVAPLFQMRVATRSRGFIRWRGNKCSTVTNQ